MFGGVSASKYWV